MNNSQTACVRTWRTWGLCIDCGKQTEPEAHIDPRTLAIRCVECCPSHGGKSDARQRNQREEAAEVHG